MKHSELDQISGDAHRVLDWLLSGFEAGKPREMLLPRFLAMKEVVDDIDTHTPLREKNLQDLELLWSKVRHLNDLFGSGDDSRETPGKACGAIEEAPVTICFLPTELSVETESADEHRVTTVDYDRHGRLLELVREFIEALVGSGDPGLVDALGHQDPYCVQCGACCGPAYDQEITASDIERIADYLQISEQELREKHILPGERSWNRRDGLIRKREDEGHEGNCTFLDSISPVESKCRIYSARPQMCRDYQVNNRLCRKKSLLLKGYEHTGNIVSCRVADGMVSLTTHHTVSNNREPFSIPLKDNDRLLELFSKVKAEVGSILTSEAI
jgi:Fe-S-cluster containining protein